MKTIFVSSGVAGLCWTVGLPVFAATFCNNIPTTFNQIITSPAGTVVVATDRPETVPAFFRRNHVIVGQLAQVDPLSIKQRTRVALQLPSNNFQGSNQAAYSTVVDLAPASEVFRKAKFPSSNTILLVQDGADLNLFHPVGYMTYSSARFFTSDVALADEKWVSQDLVYGAAPQR